MSEPVGAASPADITPARRPAASASAAGRSGMPPFTEPEARTPVPRPEEPESQPAAKPIVRRGDRLFKSAAVLSGGLIVAIIGAIGLFLLVQAVPALRMDQVNFLTSRAWNTDSLDNLRFGILDLLLVTLTVSVFALVIAMPVSLGIALFLTQYAPGRLARPFAYVVDLLAAVPSIVFGLWGIFVLAPALYPVAAWLNGHLDFIFLFSRREGAPGLQGGGNLFTAGIVLAVMILPIITAVSREVFERTPREQIEGALALGATRWEMIRTTVLPFGRAGYVSGSMLGLGRALGETIALYVILSGTAKFFSGSLFDGGSTFASKIAQAAPEFNDPTLAGAYIAAGLVLFVLTFVVNAAARAAIAGREA